MTQAWQRRAWQRQELLALLDRKTDEEEERVGHLFPFFYFSLMGIVCEYLKREQEIAQKELFRQKQFSSHGPVTDWFVKEIWEVTWGFARSVKERNALIATYLKNHVMQRVAYPFSRALTDEALENPRLIYHADSATEEVPFKEE